MTARSHAHDASLILHGHFYQPPREDPWTEEIEGEPSAAPFNDWNERIHAECYRPNAFSRVLGEYGKVRAIVNNYTHLSFNFGPTLLNWMERYDPDTLSAIVRADEESRKLNHGHGNAIAQGYNHVIMPLADSFDRETQVAWGLADFERRFGRAPESMWMPETAVCPETLSLLARVGMKYVILSPFQAAEVQAPDGSWRPVSGGNLDVARPYYIKTAHGRIAAFFYHGALASDISFAHLLRQSETFCDRLVGALGNGPLLTVATDGEIYGHHEPFGDMGLAYTLAEHLSGRSGRVKKRIRITNYGAYLEENPPVLEARLHPGASSWSCAHGVERWKADCGCRIDHGRGWNQQWRGPLRDALNRLRDELRVVFEGEGRKVFRDPWESRQAYIDVILGGYAPEVKEAFAAKWFKKNVTGTAAWQLLESQRNAMLMFTSCGWFFDDVSGIEPRQLMLYAARAIDALGEMAPPGIEERFVRRLREAKSNIPEQGDGAKIYRQIAHPRRTAKLRILNQALLANFAGVKPHGLWRYRIRVEGEAFWETGGSEEHAPPARDTRGAASSSAAAPAAAQAAGLPAGVETPEASLGRGSARVLDARTGVEKRYAWVGRFRPAPPETLIFDVGQSFRWPGGDPRGRAWDRIRPVVAERKGVVAMGLGDLFRAEARGILGEEVRRAEQDLDALLRGVVSILDPLYERARALSLPLPPEHAEMFAHSSEMLWRAHVRNGRRDEARRLEHRLERLGVPIAKEMLEADYSAEIDRLAAPLRISGRRGEQFPRFLEALRLAQESGVVLKARLAQEIVYDLMRAEGMALIGKLVNEGDRELYAEVLGILEAAERLTLDVSEARSLLAPFEARFADDPTYWP